MNFGDRGSLVGRGAVEELFAVKLRLKDRCVRSRLDAWTLTLLKRANHKRS